MRRNLCAAIFALVMPLSAFCFAETRTWDGKHDISKIEVTVVYFVPSDRPPLKDWRDRVDYFCNRIEQFHSREFDGQSVMKTVVHQEPLISESTTKQLRQGDANAIFFKTLQEADRRLEFASGDRSAFPILLVLSEINWQPLDDFYRLKPQDGGLVFEGQDINGQHFPGAAAGGARATYLSDRGVGWGLVSADGWRVPYRGSDCVIYHEGCGHTVGLPHPEPIDGSVMGVGQYQGWISESFLNKEQKIRLGWEPVASLETAQMALFTNFRAIPDPVNPKPDEAVALKLDWPDAAIVKSLRVRYQTAIESPWVEVPLEWSGNAPKLATLGAFDRATPISYRIDAALDNGATAEIWGYLQVQNDSNSRPQPLSLSADLITQSTTESSDSPPVSGDLVGQEINLLEMIDPANCWSHGEWVMEDGKLLSPKQYAARLELPYSPPAEYRMTVIAEPLDTPQALLLGQRSGENRFATLFSFGEPENYQSAIENIDGQNVGNESTFTGAIFRANQLSQIIVTVRKDRVVMSVDGHVIVNWTGSASQLSLSGYWGTPDETSLFLGAYDCRFRFHRITLQPLTK